MFARVAVLSPAGSADGREPVFDYHIPDELGDSVRIGSLLTVPFGLRSVYAVVLEVRSRAAVSDTRPVTSLVDPEPVLSPAHIDLGRWLSKETLAPLHECLQIMLPPGVVGLVDSVLELAGDVAPSQRLGRVERRLVEVLGLRGPLRGRQVDRALPRTDWRAAANRLVRRGILKRTPELQEPRARPRHIATVRLEPGADADAGLKGLRSAVYGAVLDFLRSEDAPVDVSWVYAQTGCSRYHLDKLYERGLIVFGEEEVWRDPLEGQVFLPTEPPPLTADQQTAWEKVLAALRGSAGAEEVPSDPEDAQERSFLLYGVTGSGKTEVYLRAVAETLAQGQQAIILVPEISLTPQTVSRFGGRFPGKVTVVHSKLTQGERYDVWRRARAGLVDVVIGPRSAIFSPLQTLGLIVLDEEHDSSYKQQSRPAYHARETALKLAQLTGAVVILGSATPSLEAYVSAQRGELRLLTLERRILGHVRRLADLQTVHNVRDARYRPLEGATLQARFLPLPPVTVVDMRAELRAGNRSIFSRALEGAVTQALDGGEQVILFLNRRGRATFVLCRDCGYVARCPECDLPLTVHGRESVLKCHHCNHHRQPPVECPRCGGRRIRHFGLGTQGVEAAVRERWPAARLLRWDRDTARTADAHWNILQSFSSGQADVLVGTQMIAKGLDLPLVTLVGVISADTALNLPDFRAAERTFQLMEQVAGRAGRGLRGGRVVIQTYHPDHYAIRAVEQHDYASFARQELAFRRKLDYPPFVRMARLLYAHREAQRAQVEAENLANLLADSLAGQGLPRTDLIGPAPAFFARLRGKHRWQIILRHTDPASFLRNVKLPAGWRVEVDPVSVL